MAVSHDRQAILIPKAGEFNYQEIQEYLKNLPATPSAGP